MVDAETRLKRRFSIGSKMISITNIRQHDRIATIHAVMCAKDNNMNRQLQERVTGRVELETHMQRQCIVGGQKLLRCPAVDVCAMDGRNASLLHWAAVSKDTTRQSDANSSIYCTQRHGSDNKTDELSDTITRLDQIKARV